MKFLLLDALMLFVFPGFLWWLQTFDASDSNEFLKLVIKENDTVGLLALIIILFVFFFRNWKRSSVKQKLTNEILSLILKLDYKGKDIHYRVTLFEEVYGYQMIPQLLSILFKNRKHHKEKGIGTLHKKHFPKLFNKYLRIAYRQGNPHRKGTSTYFTVANDLIEIDSITSYVYFEGMHHYVNLPDISNIDLKDYDSDYLKANSRKEDVQKVKRYLKDGKIQNIEKLKLIHRYATNIWATTLCDNNENKYGVLIIDDDSKEETVYDNSKLIAYAQMIEKINIYAK